MLIWIIEPSLLLLRLPFSIVPCHHCLRFRRNVSISAVKKKHRAQKCTKQTSPYYRIKEPIKFWCETNWEIFLTAKPFGPFVQRMVDGGWISVGSPELLGSLHFNVPNRFTRIYIPCLCVSNYAMHEPFRVLCNDYNRPYHLISTTDLLPILK